MKRRAKAFTFLVGLCALAALAYGRLIYGFLAPETPLEAAGVIVEGWIPDAEMELAARHILERDYRVVLVTGGPLDHGFFLGGYPTYAEAGRATLSRLTGRSDIVAVPARRMRKDRTYASALALKAWLDADGGGPKRLNLISSNAHTRRSRRLFQAALGSEYTIGALAIRPVSYDPDRWWAYSEGFRAVTGETVAYLYTLVIFPFTGERLPEAADSPRAAPAVLTHAPA